MRRKYVVFSATEVGVGHLLAALLQGAYYAFKTGRTLAIDMRRFHYAKRGHGHSMFLANFGWEFPQDLEVITDLDEIDRLTAGDDTHILLMSERLDVSNPFEHDVLIVPCMTPGTPYSVGLKRDDTPFRITLKGQVRQAWQRVMEMPQWEQGIVGMHFRAITGEFLERMNPIAIPDYEERYAAIKGQYVDKALEMARGAGFTDPAFFVASDSRDFVSYIKERLPSAFSVAEAIPAAGQSWQDYGATNKFDIKILTDVVIDLWGLASSDYLIHTARSAFSHFAMLNSPKLSADRAFMINVPACAEIFDTLPADTAVEWTRAAARKADVRRMQDGYPHKWLATALERAGQIAEAAVERRRVAWYDEAMFSQAINMPGEAIDWEEVDRGQFTRAIGIARRVAERLPGNPYVLAGRRSSLSNLLAQQGRLEEATNVARQALDLDQDDPRLRAHLASLLTRQSQYEEAEHELRTAIAIEPEDPSFYDELARCLAGQGRIDEAVGAIRQAASVAPDTTKWLRRINEILLGAGRAAEAEAATREAIEQGPESAALHQALGILLERQERFEEAAEQAARAAELEPREGRWGSWHGELLSRVGRYAEAETALIRAAEIDPDSAHLHHVFSITLERMNRLDEAVAEAARAAEIQPLQLARQLRPVELLMQAGRYADAEASLRRSMARLEPGAREFHILSIVLERQGRLEEASSAALRASEFEPGQRDRHIRAGELLFRGERWEEAERSLKQAIALGDQSAHLAHILSIAIERQNRLEEALQYAQRAAELRPEPLRAARVGVLLTYMGKPDEAEQTLRPVIESAPNIAILHHYLSDALVRQGRTAEAIAEAEKAIELEPNQKIFSDRLAELVSRAAREKSVQRIVEEAPQSLAAEPTSSLANGHEGETMEAGVATEESETAEAGPPELPASSESRRGNKRKRGSWLWAR